MGIYKRPSYRCLAFSFSREASTRKYFIKYYVPREPLFFVLGIATLSRDSEVIRSLNV